MPRAVEPPLYVLHNNAIEFDPQRTSANQASTAFLPWRANLDGKRAGMIDDRFEARVL